MENRELRLLFLQKVWPFQGRNLELVTHSLSLSLSLSLTHFLLSLYAIMDNGLVFDSLILIWVCRHLSIEKNRYLYIRLFPEPSRFSKEQPPLARFVLRVSNTGLNRKPYISPSMMHPVSVFWLCVYICIMLVFCLSVLCVSDFWVLCGWDVYFCAKKRKRKNL